MRENFIVWVGGVEVNDFYLTQLQAINLADQFIKNGYEDVIIEKIEESA
jgi:acetyl-CoA acetyltransferase